MSSVYQTIPTMIGKVLSSVTLSTDKEVITFTYQDGTKTRLGVEGDCCSESWIEHLEMPNDLNGATILEHRSADEVDATDDDSLNPKNESYHGRVHDCLKVYSDTFVTNRGDITLEYRNSSNGYYGGNLYVIDGEDDG